MRTILYARFSSDLQNPLSTADQLTALQERADREGWPVIGSYCDDEISGRAGISEMQRPGLNAMLARVERGDVDQILAEATDRVARHIGDAHAIREHLEHFGARLFTLSDGHVDEITGTIKGLMDARFLKDLADRIRRGKKGAHSRGLNSGGRAYGYRVIKKIGDDGELVRGLLEIDEEEAAVIRRIFNETIAGVSARTIAIKLNQDGILAPGGKQWSTNAIHGSKERKAGVLRNELYRGIMLYGRTRRYHNPKTRKVVARITPSEEWRSVDVPHLRIVTDEQWDAVVAIYANFAHKSGPRQPGPPRAKRLLSLIGKCGECGGTWSVIAPDKWGCTVRRDKGTCSNTRIISTNVYEARVLGQLKAALLDEDAIALFVDRYNAGILARRAEASTNRLPLQRKATSISDRITRLVDAIAEGAGEFAEFKDRLRTSRAELADVQHQLASMNEQTPLEISSGAINRYRDYIAHLDAALSEGGIARERAAAAIRSLIDTVSITPSSEKRGVIIKVTGRLANIINLAEHSG
ncbi:MAG: recombinase family protein [Pseudomonadota bacterium]